MHFGKEEEKQWYLTNLRPHEPMLRAWLDSRFSSTLDTEDIVQEASFRVLRVRRGRELDAPKAFLFVTARNIALNLCRKAKATSGSSHLSVDDYELPDDAADPHETLAHNQELEFLTKAIQSLPKKCRQIITMRKVYGISQSEIAKKLGISVRTVNAQISIGVRKCVDYVRIYRRERSA